MFVCCLLLTIFASNHAHYLLFIDQKRAILIASHLAGHRRDSKRLRAGVGYNERTEIREEEDEDGSRGRNAEIGQYGGRVPDCPVDQTRGRSGFGRGTVVEIETDKTSFEVAATVDGIVLATFFERGDLVPVFTPLFVIGIPARAWTHFVRNRKGHLQQLSLRARRPVRAPVAADDASPPQSSAPLSPRAQRFADEHDFHPRVVSGSGPGGRVLEADLRALYHALPPI